MPAVAGRQHPLLKALLQSSSSFLYFSFFIFARSRVITAMLRRPVQMVDCVVSAFSRRWLQQGEISICMMRVTMLAEVPDCCLSPLRAVHTHERCLSIFGRVLTRQAAVLLTSSMLRMFITSSLQGSGV